MGIDRNYFPHTGHLDKTMMVEWTTGGHFKTSGRGKIALIWLGIEEMVDVVTEDGKHITLCPALGDVVEPLYPETKRDYRRSMDGMARMVKEQNCSECQGKVAVMQGDTRSSWFEALDDENVNADCVLCGRKRISER